MKIKKQLLENENDAVIELNSNDNGKEILADVDAAAEDAGVTNSAEVAAEIVAAGDKIGAEETIGDLAEDTGLEVENKITRGLDEALQAAIRNRRRKIPESANIMICGLPGSGKTACVYDWSRRAIGENGQRVNITYVNMKNNDLDAFINGYTVQDKDDPDYVKQAFSHNLDGLDQPNSILFLDEYNRQTEDQIRASVLTLINEHYVVGKEQGGRHYFKNFLFTIAVMNPAVSTDKGAAKVNEAEKSRFPIWLSNMDSDPETTEIYLTKQYNKLVREELAKKNPDYDEIESLLRIQDLGIFIVKHPDFKYDDISKLRDLYTSDKKMLNQRALTAGLALTDGKVDKMMKWIDQGGANFLTNPTAGTSEYDDERDEATEMLLAILADYEPPTREELFKKASVKDPNAPQVDDKPNNNQGQQNNQDTNVAGQDNGTDDIEDLEDDPDFFGGGQIGSNNQTVESPNAVRSKIGAIVSGW